MYEPYDYVAISGGVLGSFRAYTERGDVAFRPVYRRAGCAWAKLTPSTAAALPGRRHLLLDRDCALARAEEVALVAPWRSRAVDASGSYARDQPAALRGLVSEMHSRGAHAYLYGSRLLGRNSAGSDWDFIVECRGDLAELLRSCNARPDAFPRWPEISSVAASYEVNTLGSTSRKDVLRILRKGWCALRVDGAVADFFLAGSGNSRIPDVRSGKVILTDCEGVIEPGSGQSFGMPRWIRIRTPTARIVHLHHVSWILCGLERMAGSRVMLRDVLVSGASDLWLSPWISKLSFNA
ncbi:nucleotidyltransferase domain-containing protein [Spongiactinospora sp. TRM90649]|uniref:nucleotidyltransferase domain-containing protein n=1 Tax=Spongiactinospora sp. TRM90649 TaxID=3031114 RepID=UPI0023F7A9F7|nr:nucleotidyltransferase domain-containing protein [Spongiactinospora sp. TRM90649]MDF5755672.1 nucleotidyltransferase domain-containing protein [Spongiactinospora sp. TRM90649]